MGRSVRDRKGQYAGSIGDGKTSAPSAGPTRPAVSRYSSGNADDAAASERALTSAWQAFTAHRGDAPPAAEPTEDTSAGARCPQCGQFVGAGTPHRCGKMRIASAVPGAQAVAMAGITAGALALGPVAVAAVGAVAALTYLAGRFIRNRMQWALTRKIHESPLQPEARLLNEQAESLAERMDVEGPVIVYVKEPKEGQGDVEQSPGAAATCDPKGGHKVIMVNQEFLDLPEKYQAAILAHEMAHLQKAGRWSTHRVRAASLPAGAAGGAAAVGVGAGVLAAGAVVGAAWFATVLASRAMSRREERRADREAYKVVGEDFAEALEHVHARTAGSVRQDLPWRAEDVFHTHGNLANRIEDMRG